MSNIWPIQIAAMHSSIKHLLPPGFAFPRDDKTNLQAVMKSIAAMQADFINQADSTLLHAIPAKACGENIDKWEESLNLPDQCTGELDNDAQRVAAIIGKLAGYELKYGNSAAGNIGFLTQLAKAVGFDVKIWTNTPFRVGNRVGQRLGANGNMYIEVIKSDRHLIVCDQFRVGSRVGQRLGNNCRAPILECLMKKIAPARFALTFIYGDQNYG